MELNDKPQTLTSSTSPTTWFYENKDKWDNEGDHIEFHCPLEEIPEEVLAYAESYARVQKEEDEEAKIYNAMGLNDINHVVYLTPDDK